MFVKPLNKWETKWKCPARKSIPWTHVFFCRRKIEMEMCPKLCWYFSYSWNILKFSDVKFSSPVFLSRFATSTSLGDFIKKYITSVWEGHQNSAKLSKCESFLVIFPSCLTVWPPFLPCAFHEHQLHFVQKKLYVSCFIESTRCWVSQCSILILAFHI